MVVHRGSCDNWLEDITAQQQAGRDAHRTPAVSFDFGVKSFEELFSPRVIPNVALPQGTPLVMPAPLMPLPMEQRAWGGSVGNESQSGDVFTLVVADEEAA